MLVILGTFISFQVVSERLSILSNGLALSSVKVVNHALVEGEQRSSSTNFSTKLQVVAIPVQERDSTPGSLYSTIALVSPLTVKIPATLGMTSTEWMYQPESVWDCTHLWE